MPIYEFKCATVTISSKNLLIFPKKTRRFIVQNVRATI